MARRRKGGGLLGALGDGLRWLFTIEQPKHLDNRVQRSGSTEERRALREQRQAELESARHQRQLAKEQRAAEHERLAAEKLRIRAERERERARKLEDQAEKARLKSTSTRVQAKARTSERRAENDDELAGRIERGEFSPGEVRELMARGRLNIKRNPAPKQLERAEESSERFHGENREVVELSPAERARLPQFVPAYGRIKSIDIEPRVGSNRGGAIWQHLFSDRGPFSPQNVRAALLVWDPRNPKRLAIVQQDDKPGNGPDLHMDESRGIVG